MTFYELLSFAHIASSIIWLGAGFLIAVLVLGAERAGDHAKEGGHHRDVGWLAPRLFIPASLATLIFGLLLVADGSWTLGQLWIVLGLCGWAVSFLLGILYFKPEAERIGALIDQEGPGSAEANRRVHRLNVVDRLQVTVLFLVVATMVIKPTGGDGVVLAVGALILVATIALAAAAVQRGRSLPTEPALPGEPAPQAPAEA